MEAAEPTPIKPGEDAIVLEPGVSISAGDIERFFELSDDLCALMDGGKIIWVNAAWERILGWSAADLVGTDWSELIHPDDIELAYTRVPELDNNGRIDEHESRVRCRDGAYRWLLWSAMSSGKRWFTSAKDITDHKTAERELAHRAQQLESARDHLHAVTESMGEGLCTIDEHGKLNYMNRAGEFLLGWAEQELRGKVMHDIVHGRRRDGSVLPMEECPILRARRDGETVRVADDIFIRKDGSELPVSYTAAPIVVNEERRGSVVVFSDITESKRREEKLRAQADSLITLERTRDALDDNRFVLYAQPVIDLASGEVTQHELLLRMRDEQGELIAPCEFLPIAEEFGLIRGIDHWVLERAVGIAALGHPVAVNVSARSLAHSQLVDHLADLLERTGADPATITIEITETALVDDQEDATAFVGRIKELGCRIALDDFGTGYGAFTYLKAMPVDYLKIDVEFVRDMHENGASRRVVEAVASLAEGLGLETIAEGVENLKTLELLSDRGVNFAQGYALGRPAPVDDLIHGESAGRGTNVVTRRDERVQASSIR